MSEKPTVGGGMRVEEGIRYGWQRAYKHTDHPTEDGFKTAIEQAVMNAICEVFEFDHEEA